jgi:hypothetical protein
METNIVDEENEENENEKPYSKEEYLKEKLVGALD